VHRVAELHGVTELHGNPLSLPVDGQKAVDAGPKQIAGKLRLGNLHRPLEQFEQKSFPERYLAAGKYFAMDLNSPVPTIRLQVSQRRKQPRAIGSVQIGNDRSPAGDAS
jgi:hypothetical protein